jgi:hypothetical protein
VNIIEAPLRAELAEKIKSPDLTTYGDVQAAIFNYMTTELYATKQTNKCYYYCCLSVKVDGAY